MMKKRALWWLIVAALAFVPASVRVQEGRYPIEIVPPGKGPFTFPAGYQTPWDRIQIFVTAKMSPNLFVVHGSEALDPAHPDASGGRVMVLFGNDGVLMVDTQNRQVAEKTLKAIREFTNAPIKVVVNTHVHGDHTGANGYGRPGRYRLLTRRALVAKTSAYTASTTSPGMPTKISTVWMMDKLNAPRRPRDHRTEQP